MFKDLKKSGVFSDIVRGGVRVRRLVLSPIGLAGR